MHRRTLKRIIFPISYNAFTDRIIKNIFDLIHNFFICSENMIVQIFLPSKRSMFLMKPKPRFLFKRFQASEYICRIRKSSQNQMAVIGHEQIDFCATGVEFQLGEQELFYRCKRFFRNEKVFSLVNTDDERTKNPPGIRCFGQPVFFFDDHCSNERVSAWTETRA